MDDTLDDAAIGSRTFSQARRGYDRREVDAFRDAVAKKVASLSSELAELKTRIHQVGLDDPRDLKAEFDAIGGEVQTILQAARTAAEEIRSRASADAVRWRSDAEAYASATREAAERQAFQARESAWETATAMLDQASEAAGDVVRTAEQETLFIRAEAEREALRMTGDARRDGEEERRAARTEAERLLLEARAKSESIIESARQSAEAAQQRTQALEERRSELMTELEAARESIGQLEHEIESRRDALFHTGAEPSGMRIISAEPTDDETGWLEDDAAGVRVVPVARFESEPVDADAMADEVRRMRQTVARAPEPVVEATVEDATENRPEPPDLGPSVPAPDEVPEAARIFEGAPESGVEAGPDASPEVDAPQTSVPVSEPEPGPLSEPEPDPERGPELESAPVQEPEPEPDRVPELESAPVQQPEPEQPPKPDDQLSDLFATLRKRPSSASPDEVQPAPDETPAPEDSPEVDEHPVEELAAVTAARDGDLSPTAADVPAVPEQAPVALTDPFELRDRLLLPVENRALRTVKRRLVDLQNRVLEELRVDGPGWAPDGAMFRAAIGDELTPVRREAYVAGLSAASELAGRTDAATPSGTPGADPTPDFVDALVAAVRSALDKERVQGSGARQVSASVSKVFRGWRTDEAERRTRWSARAAYHQGICDGLDAIGVPTVTAIAPGRPCGKCPAGTGRAWSPAGTPPDGLPLPPASPDCGATIVPAASPER